MLAIAPKFDEPTEYSYSWINRLMNTLNIDCEKLFEADATREKAEKHIPQHTLIIFYDHGTEEGLVAQGGKEYIIDKKNDHILAGKEVYTLACLWCRDGGIDAWKKGAKAVWGYTDVFAFTTTDEELFCEAANYGLTIKIKMNVSWEEALKLTKEKYNELISKAKDPWSVIWLRHNRDALVCYTENNPPQTSKCLIRRLLIKLFGPEKAWKFTPKKIVGVIMFSVGYGIALHAVASELYHKGGYAEVLRPQGEYIGLALVLIGFLLILFSPPQPNSLSHLD